MPAEAVPFTGTERFSVVRQLGAGGMGTVYEVVDRERGQAVALKVMRGHDPAALYQFKQEFRSLTHLSHPNLLPLYELFALDESWCLTMELLPDALDFTRWVTRQDEGDSASLTLTATRAATAASASIDSGAAVPHDPDEVGIQEREVGSSGVTRRLAMPADELRLRAALAQLVEGVKALHGAGMLHRDLKPENVLVTPEGRLRLLDFGLVAELQTASLPESDGRARASSPGRLRRVHESEESHFAGTVQYMSPEQSAAAPLTPASDWYAVGVMLYEALCGRRPFGGSMRAQLRAKRSADPPEPSTIADGVPADLEQLCMALLRRQPGERPTGTEVEALLAGAPAPATSAHDDDLVEPELPFVGRSEHLAALAQAFERARAGRVVVCRVHGRSGAGKSTLVEHFLEQVARRSELVILSGRCFEQESVPYKALDSLVDSLYRYLVRLPAPELASLLPDQLTALARVFPVLGRLAAAAPAADSSGGGLHEQRRLALEALGQLLARLASSRPLVLAIDDLQWGDVDSAHLLADLLQTPALSRVLVLLAYRSEYEKRSACLAALAEAEHAMTAGVDWETIEVAAMSEGETLQLALTLLGAGRPGARTLAERILRESGGNAFFVYELVHHAETGLDFGASGQVDLDEALAARVDRLAEGPRRLLETVAVAGQPIRLRDAARACGLESVPHELVRQLRAGHFARTSGPGVDDEIECFHDRVRESVAARLDLSARLACHARLAQALEAGGQAEPQTIAAHLQHSDPARASALYAQAGESAVAVLAFDRAEQYLLEGVRLAGSATERARIQELLIHFYTDMARFADAYAMGRTAVAAFGVSLPPKFNPPAFLADCALARLRLGRRPIRGLVDLPEMIDERRRWAVRIISATAKAAFQVRPELCVAISAKAVNLCLRFGNTAESAVPYMVFGAIFLGGVLGRVQAGYDFGRLALELVERFANAKQRAEVHFVVGYFGTSWLRPATEAEALWRTARTVGRETGDLFHTGCACAGIAQSLLMRGVRLDEVEREVAGHLDWLERVQLREPAGCLKAVRQTVRNLRGETSGPATFDGGTFREDELVAEIERFGSRHFAHFYFVDKMMALYLRREYRRAHELAARAAGYRKDSKGMLHGTEHLFYAGLSAAALAEEAGGSSELRRPVSRACRQFARWAERCPENYAHKHRLLAGEVARLSGATSAARAHYDAAIESARAHGYLQVEGIANERAAELLAATDPAAAAHYRQSAERAFSEWGATALASPRSSPH